MPDFERAAGRFFDFVGKLLGKKALKVGIISYYWPSPRRVADCGVAVHAYYISRELARAGAEVHAFTAGAARQTQRLGRGTLNVHKIELHSPRSVEPAVRKTMLYLKFEQQLPLEILREQKKGRFDVLNSHGWLTHGAFISKHIFGIPWVHTLHALETERIPLLAKEEREHAEISRWIEQTIQHADHLIAVSARVKAEAVRRYGIPESKISIIPNGIDLQLFFPKRAHIKRPVVMFAGRLSEEKGLALIQVAIRELLAQRRDISFLLVAPRGDARGIKSLAEFEKGLRAMSRKYPGRIKRLTKAVSQSKLAELYRACAVYVQPSLYEAFGLTALEAMACGKPVIATATGGLTELIADGKNGLLIEQSGEALAAAIARVLDDRELARAMGKAARQTAIGYSWREIGKQTYELYRKISLLR